MGVTLINTTKLQNLQ